MWDHHLRGLIGQASSSYEIVGMPNGGVSGASVVFVRDRATKIVRVLKFGEPSLNPQHSITSQVHNRELLVPLYGDHHLPKVIVANDQAFLMNMVHGENLYEVVQHGTVEPRYLQSLTELVLWKFTEVWKKTKVPFRSCGELARDPLKRFDRIQGSLYGRSFGGVVLEKYLDTPLCINGQSLPCLREIFAGMSSLYVSPKWVVTCHGDPNGENILIDRDYGWWLLDWEWTGLHDWRVVASFFTGWWISNASLVRRSSMTLQNGKLVVNYELVVDELATVIIDQAWKFAEQAAVDFSEDNWREQVTLQIATLLLGDIRFLEERKRPGHDISLLGEGVRLLASLL